MMILPKNTKKKQTQNIVVIYTIVNDRTIVLYYN